MSARLKLHMLRWAREKPTTVIVVLIFVALALLSLLRRCPPCEACRRVQGVAISALATAAAASSETVLLDALPRDFRDDDERTTMAHVVIGVMTARRFHKTRCRAQMETWLRRARRVVFFSDSSEGAPSYDLQAPLVAHHFVPSATERIFEGGNWRAVPILRALAHGFFSEPAQAAMRERAEPLPRWTFMLDDDSYVFTIRCSRRPGSTPTAALPGIRLHRGAAPRGIVPRGSRCLPMAARASPSRAAL